MALGGATAANGALWAKVFELEAQLAAYKILHGNDAPWDVSLEAGSSGCCRGVRYESYMRRREARRTGGRALPAAFEQAGAAVLERREQGRPRSHAGRSSSSRPSLDMQEHPSIDSVQKEQRPPCLPRSSSASGASAAPTRRTQPPASAASTLRKQNRAEATGTAPRHPPTALPRCRTANGGAHHRRSSSLAGAVDFSKSTVPKPPTQECAGVGHARSASEFARNSEPDSPRAGSGVRARRRWGSPEKPAMLSGESAKDSGRGWKKLLSSVRNSSKSEQSKSVKRSLL